VVRAAVALLAIVAALAGCDDETAPPEPTPPPPGATTPDKVIANFKAVYFGMDLASYRDFVLDDEYTFVLQPATVEEFGLADSTLDRAEELAVTERMFSGLADHLGQVITSIELQSLQPQGAWQRPEADDPYFGDVPGTLVRLYEITANVYIQGDFHYEMNGEQIFVVVADTFLVEGVPTPFYHLRGQIDRTVLSPLATRPVDQVTWSTLKALFLE